MAADFYAILLFSNHRSFEHFGMDLLPVDCFDTQLPRYYFLNHFQTTRPLYNLAFFVYQDVLFLRKYPYGRILILNFQKKTMIAYRLLNTL